MRKVDYVGVWGGPLAQKIDCLDSTPPPHDLMLLFLAHFSWIGSKKPAVTPIA